MTVASPDDPSFAAGADREVASSGLVLFGATGDLARRKLFPALYNLAHAGRLPDDFGMIASSRRRLTDEEFRNYAADAIGVHSRRAPDDRILARLLARLRYLPGRADDPRLFDLLGAELARLDYEAGKPLNRVFYLSTGPSLLSPIVGGLGLRGLHAHAEASVRILIEKPFGTTLAEARAFNDSIRLVFDESQVFRIDHYLGKETVQNILALRFANAIFEPIWNRNTISSVQITVAEEIGIGTRAEYYDAAGALRDMIASHMLQLLCMMCMEPPTDLSAEAIRDEKVKVLRVISSPSADAAMRGRYEAGTVQGASVAGYLEEQGIAADSGTETFAALRLSVDNWRWAGVPFYLRTGKRLARRETEIAVTLRPAPHLAFQRATPAGMVPNQLVLGVQPNERIHFELAVKTPGAGMAVEPVTLGLDYGPSFADRSAEAYERLLLDALRGDATLFTRSDEVEEQWRICDPVVERWAGDRSAPSLYAAGSQGPEDADRVLLPGHRWRSI